MGGPASTEIRVKPMTQQKSDLTASMTCRRYSISDMTLWRWQHDDKPNFPKPIVINRRRYWDEDELVFWERRRVGLNHNSKSVAA